MKLFNGRWMIWIGCLPALSMVHAQQADAIKQIHHAAFVIDTHTDTPMNLIKDGFDPAVRHEYKDARVDFPGLRQGDIDAVFFALFTTQRSRIPDNYHQSYELANRMLDSTLCFVKRNSRLVQMAYSSKDITDISASNKTAICLGMENGFPLAKDINRVKEYYDKGVRYITLCHSLNNDICDSSTDKKGSEHDGLSDFGRDVVAEMNRLGMIVDVSHISDKSFYDVLSVSKAPVIASHSSVRSLCNHPRNMTDDMIKVLADKGGVIQICILGAYITPEDTTSLNYIKLEELRKKYRNWNYSDEAERKKAWAEYDSIDQLFPPELPFVAQAVDHIDHVVKIAGIDHVGIGSDFDGGGGLADCRDVTEFPEITKELVNRGYSKEDIGKIWGGNFLRVFREVENAAEK